VTLPRRAYPTDLSDAEWRLVQPLIPPVKSGGRPPATADVSWSMPSPTGSVPAAPGDCSRTTCRPGRPSITTGGSGGVRAAGADPDRATRTRTGPPRPRPPPSAGIIDSQSVRITDRGLARLRRRQEGERAQAPPAGRHPRPPTPRTSDHRQCRRSRRRRHAPARLRRPSSRRQRHDSHRGAGLTQRHREGSIRAESSTSSCGL
jgi:transposase